MLPMCSLLVQTSLCLPLQAQSPYPSASSRCSRSRRPPLSLLPPPPPRILLSPWRSSAVQAHRRRHRPRRAEMEEIEAKNMAMCLPLLRSSRLQRGPLSTLHCRHDPRVCRSVSRHLHVLEDNRSLLVHPPSLVLLLCPRLLRSLSLLHPTPPLPRTPSLPHHRPLLPLHVHTHMMLLRHMLLVLTLVLSRPLRCFRPPRSQP